jgi:hypothetical protein
MTREDFLVSVLGVTLSACATSKSTPPKTVDLTPTREAIEAARKAGAEDRAKENYSRAVVHLKEAEALLATGKQESLEEVRWLSRLATAEASCAASVAPLAQACPPPPPLPSPVPLRPSPEVERLTSRLKKSEEEQRRLEDRIGALQRDLDLTETELIRTKARLTGLDTKAEASSAVAEAVVLANRIAAEKKRAEIVKRCRDALSRAEELLRQENYSAAIFFARKVQEFARGEIASVPAETHPAPSKTLLVLSPANIRAGPSVDDAIVGQAPEGATLDATVVKGDWIQVRYREITGWIYRSLVRAP